MTAVPGRWARTGMALCALLALLAAACPSRRDAEPGPDEGRDGSAASSARENATFRCADPPPRPETPLPPQGARPPVVRIQLVSVVKEGGASVVAGGRWRLQALDGSEIAAGATTFSGELTIEGPSAVLGRHRLPRDGAVLTGTSLRVGEKRYPGALRVARTVEGGFRVAVETDLETYLVGVVLGELPPDFPPEARRAQAIVARTYALSQPGSDFTREAVVVDDTGATDQEYAGSDAQSDVLAAAREAVSSTRGLVVTRGGRPVRAWYHSTCGGRTCPATAVFRVPEARDIPGVPCGNCSTSPRYRWDARLPALDVLRASGLTGKLLSFEVAESVEGGRASAFRVRSSHKTATVAAADFRLAVGPSRLRSTWIDRAVVDRGELVVSGRGWGHGVGLCQWAARERALRGARAEAIVTHYYAGTELKRLW